MIINIIVGKLAVLTTYFSFLIIYDLPYLPGKQRTSCSSNTNSEKKLEHQIVILNTVFKEDSNYHV